MSANFYDDFRNPRNEIRQKKLFRKKTIYGIFRIPKCIKKNNLNDYIISKRQII